jgi:hypothetical protein
MLKAVHPLLLALALSVVEFQQQAPTDETFRPKTSRQALQEMGIGIDPPSLKAALDNSDPFVRGLAAMQLATSKITTAAPDIERALGRETNPYTQLKMAGSLFQLSPSQGLPYMISLCQGPRVGKDIMLNAALGLVILDRQGPPASACVPQLMTFLNQDSDAFHQANALSILTSYRSQLPLATWNEIRALSIRFLSSSNFGLKAAAVRALKADGSTEAQAALQKAAATDPNPDHPLPQRCTATQSHHF